LTQRGGWGWFQELLGTLRGIADARGPMGAGGRPATIADVATRWVADRPGVAAVLVGARNADHAAEAVGAFNLSPLTSEEIATIDAVLERGKPARGDVYDWERGGLW